MCGRYRRRSDRQRIGETFDVGEGPDEVEFSPSDDITPGTFQPVVYVTEDGKRRIDCMYWGFDLPQRFVFNARSDSLATNTLWKAALPQQRCIVPADAIFEWQHLYKNKKNPKYEIAIPGQEPFGMAAIWRPWKEPKTGKTVRTVAIITTDPNEAWARLHSRQTAILEPREYAEWLAPAERPPLHLLRVFPKEKMQIARVERAEEQLSFDGL